MENVSEETYRKAMGTVFSELLVDEVYEEVFPKKKETVVSACSSFLYQRADSAVQCLQLLNEKEKPGDLFNNGLRLSAKNQAKKQFETDQSVLY